MSQYYYNQYVQHAYSPGTAAAPPFIGGPQRARPTHATPPGQPTHATHGAPSGQPDFSSLASPNDVAGAYAALWLRPGAPLPVVKAAYRALAAHHHPDAGGDPTAMTRLNQAYALLKEHLERTA